MALVVDRVKETSVTSGTGTYALDGPVTGFQSFVAGVGDGNECYYIVTDGIDFEVGIGTVANPSSGDTLTRDTILSSSNGDAAVSWSGASLNVFVTIAADRAQIDPKINGGRLTLVDNDPVPTADQSNKTSLFFEPYNGDLIALFNGNDWRLFSLGSGVTITNGGLAVDTNYDVFLFDSSGTLTLQLIAWTDATNRATAITRQNGIFVKSGDTGKRFLGTLRTVDDSSTAKFEDSKQKRFVVNYQNRIWVVAFREETTDSWAEAGNGTWSTVNADGAVWKWETIIPVSGEYPWEAVASLLANMAAGEGYVVAVDEGWTSGVPSRQTGEWGRVINNNLASETKPAIAHYKSNPAEGYRFLQAVETTTSAGSVSVFGDNSGSLSVQTAMGASLWR